MNFTLEKIKTSVILSLREVLIAAEILTMSKSTRNTPDTFDPEKIVWVPHDRKWGTTSNWCVLLKEKTSKDLKNMTFHLQAHVSGHFASELDKPGMHSTRVSWKKGTPECDKAVRFFDDLADAANELIEDSDKKKVGMIPDPKEIEKKKKSGDIPKNFEVEPHVIESPLKYDEAKEEYFLWANLAVQPATIKTAGDKEFTVPACQLTYVGKLRDTHLDINKMAQKSYDGIVELSLELRGKESLGVRRLKFGAKVYSAYITAIQDASSSNDEDLIAMARERAEDVDPDDLEFLMASGDKEKAAQDDMSAIEHLKADESRKANPAKRMGDDSGSESSSEEKPSVNKRFVKNLH